MAISRSERDWDKKIYGTVKHTLTALFELTEKDIQDLKNSNRVILIEDECYKVPLSVNESGVQTITLEKL